MTGAWLIVWDCGCGDAAVDEKTLPTVCPGHGRPPIYSNMGEATTWIAQVVMLGHECNTDGSPPCPPATVTRPAAPVPDEPSVSRAPSGTSST